MLFALVLLFFLFNSYVSKRTGFKSFNFLVSGLEFVIHNFLLRKFLFCAEFFLILIAIDFFKMAAPPSCFLESFSFISMNPDKLGKLGSRTQQTQLYEFCWFDKAPSKPSQNLAFYLF